MTRFENFGDAAYEIANLIKAAIEAADWGGDEVICSRATSSQSCSTYLEVHFERNDELSDDFVVRISDHEARTCNRTGDFNITFGRIIGDTDELLRVEEIVDADGDYVAIEIDGEAITTAAGRALAAVHRFHTAAEF